MALGVVIPPGAPNQYRSEGEQNMELTPIEGAKPEIPTAPAGFKAAGRRLWKSLHGAYDFTDAAEKVVVLEQAPSG